MPDGVAFALRRAVAADADAIAALTREAYAKWVPILGRAPKPMTADYGAAVREHRIDLLHAEGKLVALIELIVAPDHLLIENLAVSPASQRQGHGRRLMAHAEDVARGLGLLEIRLYTNALFAENIAFYRRLGYGVDSEEPFKGGRLVNMSRRICESFAG